MTHLHVLVTRVITCNNAPSDPCKFPTYRGDRRKSCRRLLCQRLNRLRSRRAPSNAAAQAVRIARCAYRPVANDYISSNNSKFRDGIELGALSQDGPRSDPTLGIDLGRGRGGVACIRVDSFFFFRESEGAASALALAPLPSLLWRLPFRAGLCSFREVPTRPLYWTRGRGDRLVVALRAQNRLVGRRNAAAGSCESAEAFWVRGFDREPIESLGAPRRPGPWHAGIFYRIGIICCDPIGKTRSNKQKLKLSH